MIDRLIARLAACQNGVVTRWQLLAAGVSAHAIAWRVKTGRLHVVHPGIYIVGTPTRTPLALERAALLACGDGALLSHLTAAVQWGIVPRNDGSIHVTIAGRQCGRPAGVTVHRTSLLHRDDVRHRHDLPLTSPACTLLDLAADTAGISDRELDRALNEARVLKLVRDRDFKDVLARGRRRRGAARLAALIGRYAGPSITRSEAERRLLELIRAAGLPEPETNVRIHGFEVDFLWRRQRVVVEVDGFAFHATPRAFERDHRRDQVLEVHGIAVKRVTWLQIVDEPYATVASVAWTLAAALTNPARATLAAALNPHAQPSPRP